ncbi:MAG: hypothetical protein PWP34_2401 [Desulfuromonadales bacterium]|nr:hypothetical protein [Desulfuromonadales bacterium]
MKTYFLILRARPVPGNPNFGVVPGVSAYFWVRERRPDGAMRRARHYLKHQGWGLERIELDAMLSGPALHSWSENESAAYRKAQEFGISMFLK